MGYSHSWNFSHRFLGSDGINIHDYIIILLLLFIIMSCVNICTSCTIIIMVYYTYYYYACVVWSLLLPCMMYNIWAWDPIIIIIINNLGIRIQIYRQTLVCIWKLETRWWSGGSPSNQLDEIREEAKSEGASVAGEGDVSRDSATDDRLTNGFRQQRQQQPTSNKKKVS